MAEELLCSEDRSSPAVCCCICEYPMPQLCIGHLSSHSTEDEDFSHFHLPLSAESIVTSETLWEEKRSWLSRLHTAFTEVKKNLDEISAFERMLEAYRLEAIQCVEEQFGEAKERVAAVKAAFKTELQAALRDTTVHALDAWTPSEQLSSLLWNFDPRNPETLKLFHFRVDRDFASLSRVFSFSLDTQLAALANCSQSLCRESVSLETLDTQSDAEYRCFSGPRMSDESHWNDSWESKRQGDDLFSQLYTAQEEVAKLQTENKRLSAQVASLLTKSTISSLINRIEKVQKTHSKRSSSVSKRTSHASTAPLRAFHRSTNWAVKEGLILSSACYDRECKGYDVKVIELKGIGEFEFDRATRSWRCPQCRKKTGGLAKISFYKAKWRVEAVLETGAVETFQGVAATGESEHFHQDLSWKKVIVTTLRL